MFNVSQWRVKLAVLRQPLVVLTTLLMQKVHIIVSYIWPFAASVP